MTNVVIDSSVLVKWLNQTDEKDLENADKILEDAKNSKINLFAPEIAKYEVGNVLLCGKKLTPTQASISLVSLYTLPIIFIPDSEEMAKDTFKLGYEPNITYYDAAFLSLAKRYNAILVTENIKHQDKNKSVRVVSLKDYSDTTIS